jgi:hypothetical protein
MATAAQQLQLRNCLNAKLHSRKTACSGFLADGGHQLSTQHRMCGELRSRGQFPKNSMTRLA